MEQDRAHREDLAKLEMRLPTSMAEIKLDALVGQGETSSILLGTFASVTLTVYSFVLSKVEQAGELKSLHTAVEVNALLRQSVLDISQSFLPRSACALRENNALHLLFKGGVVCDLSVFLKQQSTKSKQNSILPETVVAYIAGCVVTALAALHKASIIYRGVQPENLYVDTEGRVVLLDHRTCKVGGIDMLSYTLCGAADYLAPEQVSLTGHGRAVDLWALGVLLYEIAAGASPFAQGGEVATFHKISSLGTASYPQVQVPSFVVPTIKSLISKLIVPDPSQRLGMGLGGFDDVRLEPLFTGLHWKTLYLDPSPLQVFAKEMLNDIVVDAEGVGNIGETEGWYENSKVEFDLY